MVLFASAFAGTGRVYGVTDVTWTFVGVTFNDGGTLNGSATYYANGTWTWDLTTSLVGPITNVHNGTMGFHYTSDANEFEFTFSYPGGNGGINQEFETNDNGDQLWFQATSGNRFAYVPFYPDQPATYNLANDQAEEYALPNGITGYGGLRYSVSGLLVGQAVIEPLPPGVAPIDTKQSFYVASGVTGGTISPDFQGGTLRIDTATVFGQNFLVESTGGTVDTYKNTALFSGGNITGAGSLTITDSLNNSNTAVGGLFLLGEPATYLGATTINSGATARLVAATAMLPSTTDLTLNGTFALNGWGQTLASLAGTDPTALLDLGATGTFTVNSSETKTYAGAITGTGSAAFALTNGASLTLTGTSNYAGGTTIDGTSSMTIANTGLITKTAFVVNNGKLALTNSGSLQTPGYVNNSGKVSIGPTASLAANAYNQSSGSTLLDGGSLTAPTASITGGVFGGTGTFTGNLTLTGAGVQVGASPDPLHVVGNYQQTGGSLAFEIDPNGAGGFLVSSLIFDPGSTLSVTGANIVFNFKNGADPLAFFNSGKFNFNTFLQNSDASVFSAEFTLHNLFQGDTFTAASSDFNIATFAFTPDQGATQLTESVPEPATLSLLTIGALALLRRSSRRPRESRCL